MSFITIPDEFEGYPVDQFSVPNHYVNDLKSVMIPKGFVLDRTERMASDIFHSLDHSKSLVCLCVLKGGFQFFSDLMNYIQQLNSHSEKSCQISVDFIRLKSYQDDQSTGTVHVIGSDDLSGIKNKNVLIVEDMVDTGRTMIKLLSVLDKFNPATVKVASLLVKRTPANRYRPDFAGFEVPNQFLVGYALDYNEYFRDLSHICIINENCREKYKLKK